MTIFSKKNWSILALCLVFFISTKGQNSRIKCYFNHPVNISLSTGTNAKYLIGTFPDTIISYINKAKYTLDIAVYNYTSSGTDAVSKIATAVNNAYARGVVVRWINDGTSSNTGLKLLNPTIPRLSSPTSSSYTIMHNKFLVLDVNSPDTNDAFVISGSYNFSSQQTVTDYNNLIIIQDQKVANAYYNQFNQMWGGTANLPDTTKSLFGSHKKTSPIHYFNVGGTKVQIHFSPKDSCNKYLAAVINSASNDLTFGIYTFTDNTIANAILSKFNASLNVRGIEDAFSKNYSPFTTLSTPLGNNFVVYTGSGLYHSKVMVADALKSSSDPQVATGSYNWTVAATTSNDENFIVIHDANIVNQYYQALCNDISVNGGTACISPLPISFISFIGIVSASKQIILNWNISDGINIDHFEIEHSYSGTNFERIGNIFNTLEGSKKNYNFTDNDINPGTNYYRVKQVDNDGNYTFSKTIVLNVENDNLVSISPNPAVNTLQIKYPSKTTLINIYDMVGRKVYLQNVNKQTTSTLPIANLAKGRYNVEIITSDKKIMKSFFKQ